MTDFIIVLHDLKAVKAFSSRMHLSLGAGLSAAAGPIGRALEADVRASEKGSGICYTYSCSKGNKKVASENYCCCFRCALDMTEMGGNQHNFNTVIK